LSFRQLPTTLFGRTLTVDVLRLLITDLLLLAQLLLDMASCRRLCLSELLVLLDFGTCLAQIRLQCPTR
jgi:hypothetical protein